MERDRDKKSTLKPSSSSTLAAIASAAQSTTMKKSSSFSFTAVAAVAGSSSKGGGSAAAPKLDLAKLSMLAKGGSAVKKPVDDSFKRWEEMRLKKLEALNLKPWKKSGASTSVTATSSSSSTNPQPSTTTTTTTISIPKSVSMPNTSKPVEKRPKTKPEVLVKYNHQDSIQPPPLRPRNPYQQHKPHRHRERERSHSRRPKISLHPSWYTENITNQSMDDSDDGSGIVKRPLTTSASFSHYNRSNRFGRYRNSFHNFDFNGNNRTNNINININNTANTRLHGLNHYHHSSSFEDDGYDCDFPPTAVPTQQQQQYFERYRQYPKSHSCSFAERHTRERSMVADARSRSVPKSQSFTG